VFGDLGDSNEPNSGVLIVTCRILGRAGARPSRNVTGSPNERWAKVGVPPSAIGGGLNGIYAGTEQRQSFKFLHAAF